MHMPKNSEQPLLPAYLIVGEDHLKRDTALKRLRLRLERMGDLSFNSDTFDGAQASGTSIVAACTTMPFASEKRLVVVINAERLSSESTKALCTYIEKPNDTTVLAVVADKLPRNRSLYKAISSGGAKSVIDCTPPKRKDLPSQVRAMAPVHGITVTPKAAQLLVDLVGEDTVHLDEELRKLSLAYSGSDPVTDSQVEMLVARVAEAKPWAFTDAFASRDLKECMRLLALMPSTSAFSLLYQCVSRTRELMCAKCACEESSNPQATVVSELNLGKMSWKAKNYLAWSKNFTGEELRRALVSALECERKMKSGSSQEAAFKEWVVEVLKRPYSAASSAAST